MVSAAAKRRRRRLPATVIRRKQLPTTVIHRIQSFLSPQEATQTTLVSKSWRDAWSTRPTLVLDESDFPKSSSYYDKSLNLDPLVEFATNTFRTYEESKLTPIRIETFRLSLSSHWYVPLGLANRWTLKALELGATDLTIRFENITLIPVDDVFGSESLASLNLEATKIDRLDVVKCSGLKSLTLYKVEISIDAFLNVISCCPSIETLSLCHVNRTRYSGKTIGTGLPKLTSLVLLNVGFRFQTLFLDSMSSKFPNLKDLTIRMSTDSEKEVRIVISSRSLQILNFIITTDEKKDIDVSAEFDVPSIRKFMFDFDGKDLPSLSFRSTSSGYQWESRVSLSPKSRLGTKWLCELRRLLEKLRQSKINVYLNVDDKKGFDYRKGAIESSDVIEVEDMTVNTNGLPTLSFRALLDALFRMCRPKTITQYIPEGVDRKNDLFLLRELEQGMKVKRFLIPSQYMYGLRDLEEVNLLKLSGGVWRAPLPYESILDYSSKQRRNRFQLKWKPL